MTKINIADFSTKPFGRYTGDGKFSGERFRREKLLPAFSLGDDEIEVYLVPVQKRLFLIILHRC